MDFVSPQIGTVSTVPPQLVELNEVKRCSACEFPFNPNEFPDIPKAFRERVAMFHTPRPGSKEQDPESSHRISSKEHWVRFDRSDPKSFPPPDVEVVVETERGQTFSARFIQKTTDFSLRYALWGNQGAVTRWRYPGKNQIHH